MSFGFFFIFFAACCATAATGSLFPTGKWYAGLRKPFWTPPNWIFPIAWTGLYIILSYVGMRAALRIDGQAVLALWALQASLSTLWTPVFFGLKKMGTAFIVMSSLWLSVFAMVIFCWKLEAVLGIILLPYLVWVSFAAALNFSVWQLNPHETPRDLSS